MNKGIFIKVIAVVLFLAAVAVLLHRTIFTVKRKDITPKVIAENTWSGYKHFFLDADGRVKRPKEGDTVSEGQAYAMLRAVWMDDKKTFDGCYRWTEENLSRKNKTGDNLLAWHWKDGKVLDWMPASDADVDYALSLVFANSRWKGLAPSGIEDYGEKATKVLGDILRLETYSTGSGRLYLSPWILSDAEGIKRFPVNPSYYSPAHFRIFYLGTRDKRWLALVDTTYYILSSLSGTFDGKNGVGLIPDWCSVDNNDKFYPLEGKNSGFGWEAVRVPIRIAMDYFWFESREARDFFNAGFSAFIEKEWEKKEAVFCEYDYSGTPANKYENPLFYASYYHALIISGSEYSREFLNKTRAYIKKHGSNWIYQSGEEYYVNSLAWFAEGFISKIIRNLT